MKTKSNLIGQAWLSIIHGSWMDDKHISKGKNPHPEKTIPSENPGKQGKLQGVIMQEKERRYLVRIIGDDIENNGDGGRILQGRCVMLNMY